MTEKSSMNNDSKSISNGQYGIFLLVFAAVTATLLGGGLWVLNFVFGRADVADGPDRGTSLIYVDYDSDTSKYLKSESLVGMGVWIQQNPEPVNAQVLTGMTSAEIAGYMVYGVSAGLQQDCSYCHNVNDFSSDVMDDPVVSARKIQARAHLSMTADLNQNWLTQLAGLSDQKQPSGAQIACATCHNGQAKFQTWPDEIPALPDDFRLPLEAYALPLQTPTVLQVNARKDISLDAVQYNQYAMYHMNTAMGVGCTHCHNSRYFPSYERPSKYYALHMLSMSQHIAATYGDVINNQDPSCAMCHQGAIIPPGAARSAADIPAAISSDPQRSGMLGASQ